MTSIASTIIILITMIKRKYAEHKLSDETLERLKIRAIKEKVTQAELITRAVEIYLHEPIDKRDNQD